MLATTVAIPLVLALAGTPPPAAQQINRGKNAILERQTDSVPGWPWLDKGLQPSPNLGGIIALSLLRMYEQNKDPATWVTLVQYSNHLREQYASRDRLPFKADVEFLVRMYDAGLDDDGARFARELFARVEQISPTGVDEYNRIANGRRNTRDVIGYDIALSIRAALAVGNTGYANQLADAAIQDGRMHPVNGQKLFQITSLGAMVHAVSLLARPQDAARLAEAARSLVTSQASQGSWANNATQATAYAVLGLASVRSVRDADDAAVRGRRWLARRQLQSGAWATYHDGMPEPFVGQVIPLVQAEAFSALMPGI